MDQSDIVAMLKAYGFDGLSLISHEGQTSTYKYATTNARLLKALGEYTVAAGGKVAVYEVVGVARIGLCPSKDIVRFIYKGKVRTTVKNQTVDKEVTITPELTLAFFKAQATPGKQLAYCKKLWHYLNTTKFGGRMGEPKLIVSTTCPFMTKDLKNARGVYGHHSDGKPGTLWMNTMVFKATEQTFLTIFLHEMCHQACNQIDRLSSAQNAVEKGHGPEWRTWMVHVGLNPSRYDHTDALEYGTSAERLAEKARKMDNYGLTVTTKSFLGLTKVTFADIADYGAFMTEYEGLAAHGQKIGNRMEILRRGGKTRTVETPKPGQIFYIQPAK